MHPYELGRNLREHGDDRSIKFNHGSLYMVIGQLARAGFITEQETSRAGQRPERTVYALTDAGRDELRDWLARAGRAAAARVPRVRGRAVADRARCRPARSSACCGHRLGHLARQQAEARGLIDTSLAERGTRALPDRGGVPARRCWKPNRPSPAGSSSASPTPPPTGPARGPHSTARTPRPPKENEMNTARTSAADHRRR